MCLYFFDCRPVGWDVAVLWLFKTIQTSFVFKGGKSPIDIEYPLQKEPTQPPNGFEWWPNNNPRWEAFPNEDPREHQNYCL